MSEKTKNRSLFTMVATMLLAAFMAVLFLPANTAKADTYYYADEPAEVSLGLANVFTWTGSEYTVMDTTQEVALSESSSVSWYFGGTIGHCKTETHDWNVNENYAFLLDFTETWGGTFFLEYGHYDIQIDKENNKIMFGLGGATNIVNVEAPGLSALTGMQKVNYITRVIYSDEGKQNPVGVRSEVTIGDDISCAYDRIGTYHISCAAAHTYRFVNVTGLSLRIDLNIPVTYYYADEPAEVPLGLTNVFALTNSGYVALENTKEVTLSESSSISWYFGGTLGSCKTETHDWNANENYAFMLDFTETWGGTFFLEYGHYDIQIDKENNKIMFGLGGATNIVNVEAPGLSALTGMQKVNYITRVIYSDEGKQNPVGVRSEVTIGDDISCVYERIGAQHISCTVAHTYRFVNVTGINLRFSLKVPATTYYADEAEEESIGHTNVFTWAGSENIVLENTKKITLENDYVGYFGGTVGSCKTESHDWNLNENYAFMLDFTDTWTGTFFIEYGHYNIEIDKENNVIKLGIGGGYNPVSVEAPGLSALTGMKKVNVISKVIYSDIDKQNAVGMQYVVNIGNDFTWSYDWQTTAHLMCTAAHMFRFVNITGVEVGFCLVLTPEVRTNAISAINNALEDEYVTEHETIAMEIVGRYEELINAETDLDEIETLKGNAISELNEVSAGHDYGEEIAEVPATCEAAGVAAYYECSECGKLFVKDGDEYVEKTAEELVIPAGHKYGEIIAEVPATCEAAGVAAHYECSGCGKLFVKDGDEYVEKTVEELVISAKGHELVWIEEVPATTEEYGVVAHWHCEECGKNFDETKENELSDENMKIEKLPEVDGCFGGIGSSLGLLVAVMLGSAACMMKKKKEN